MMQAETPGRRSLIRASPSPADFLVRSQGRPMRTTHLVRYGIHLTLFGWLALGMAGCQSKSTPIETAAGRPATGAGVDAEVPHPAPAPETAPQAIAPLDTLHHEAMTAEQAFDASVQQTGRAIEQ